MAERAVITAIILMIVLSICMYLTECFVPIGKNMDFRDTCRSYLMKMEYKSGLAEEDRQSLVASLEKMGFCDISVSAPNASKAGTVMTLDVYAVYRHSMLSNIFNRTEREYSMMYTRKAIARKVVNR